MLFFKGNQFIHLELQCSSFFAKITHRFCYRADSTKWLEKLAPHEPIKQYQHNNTGEDNADSHLKRQIMGREVVVAVTNGALDFGTWEQIFYGEFDGQRQKRVLVKIIGE